MVSYFSAESAAFCAAKEMKSCTRTGNLDNAEKLLAELEAGLEHLNAALQAFISGDEAGSGLSSEEIATRNPTT